MGKFGVATFDQRLFLGGIELKDTTVTLADLKVTPETVFILKVRFKILLVLICVCLCVCNFSTDK